LKKMKVFAQTIVAVAVLASCTLPSSIPFVKTTPLPTPLRGEGDVRKAQLEKELAALHLELASVKAYIADKNMPPDPSMPVVPSAPAPAPVTSAPPAALPKATEPLSLKSSSALALATELRAAPVVVAAVNTEPSTAAPPIDRAFNLSMTYDLGKSAFTPTEPVAVVLLETAKVSQRIDIRGRTDSEVKSLMEKEIAHKRAMNAYYFFVNNDIPAKRIKVTYQSAGHFIADNSTPEGRAQNRRVEIEMKRDGKTLLKQGVPS
jgi:outer membrane protein OmpA-like peptidoglycan-associated protein